MISLFEKLRQRKYLARARLRNPDKYVGGFAEILVWEEWFALTRRGTGPRIAFALGASNEMIDYQGRNPLNRFLHPIRWRAYEFGRKFVALFAIQQKSGDIKDVKAFVVNHVRTLGVI